MFSSHATPMNRIRRSAATPATTAVNSNGDNKELIAVTTATNAFPESPNMSSLSKRKSPTVPTSTTSLAGQRLTSPRVHGDFHVLHQGVEQQRSVVREARSSLASSLDRLGEHHVRQKEYDNAMDAFAEALHEKRSIFANVISGSWFAQCHGHTMGNVCDATAPEDIKLHDRAIDEIVSTLRNMGNVHSLRGEQDEAMRYFTEVTNLRATKASTSKFDGSDDTTTLFSGLGGDEDNSTLMSEINEDVKALDDMFRSISFRSSREANSLWQSCRKAKPPLSSTPENLESLSNKRLKSETSSTSDQSKYVGLESEPFRRSLSLGFPTSGNELPEALEMLKSVLESYQGPNLDEHKETFNSLALRVDLLCENSKKTSKTTTSTPGCSGCTDSASTNFVSNLELALEIYKQVVAVQNEMQTLPQHSTEQAQTQLCANSASTLIRMGSLYYKLGKRTEELRMYMEAKTVYSQTFGENHSFVAGTRKNIGMVLAERGEYEDAMNEFEKARQIYLTVNNNNEMSRDVASAISCMGNVKNRVGELDVALQLYMDAVRIYKVLQKDATGPERSAVAIKDVSSTLKVIGMVHAKKGDLDTAMGFFTEAMSTLKSSGADQTIIGRETTASVLTRMASIHVKKGDLDSAMEHYREAYEITVLVRGTTNHQEVAGILHYIGGVFHKRADYDEAMNCYQEAIRIYHSTLGPGSPTVAGTLVMVGSIHYKRRNLDSAMMFYREALRLNRDAYGLHHPDVAPILKSIGTILTKKGEYHEAYDVFRDVLSIKCTVFGTSHPEVASAYKSLGNVHYKLGELADAERQYRHALNIYRHSRGEEHPDTIAARTTIEHIRYWMKERGQRNHDEQRQSRSTSRSNNSNSANERQYQQEDDERSC
jgi:tetratricopeptide (TPR) repeat protein